MDVAALDQIQESYQRVFTPTSPVTNLRRLFGREDDFEALCQAISAGRIVALHGAGGVGKTSLAILAAALCSRKAFHYEALRGDTLDNVLYVLLKQFKLEWNAPPGGDDVESLMQAGAMLLGAGFKRVLRNDIERITVGAPSSEELDESSRKVGTVLVLDNFEQLGPKANFSSLPNFFRLVADNYPRFGLVLVGESRKIDQLIPSHELFSEKIEIQEVRELSSDSLLEIIESGCRELDIAIDSKAKDYILEESIGNLRDVHRYGQDCVQMLIERIKSPEDPKTAFIIDIQECYMAEPSSVG